MRRSAEALKLRRERCPPVEPCTEAPRYNHACHAAFVGRMEDAWYLQLRRKDGTKAARVPYHCASRRHQGPCQDLWTRRVHGRAMEALADVDPRACMFWVLTLDKLGRHGGRRFRSRQEAYKALPWAKLQERINYRLSKLEHPRLRYFATVERHKDGWPHLNVLVVDDHLAESLRARDADLGEHPELDDDDCIMAPAYWCELAVAAGFGPRFTAEVARSAKHVVEYITKLAKGDDEWEVDGQGNLVLIGEVVKGSQAPEDAPKGCRSLRSSRRFLPTRRKSEDWTGWLEDDDGSRITRTSPREQLRRGHFDGAAGDFGDQVAASLGERRPKRSTGRVWHLDAEDGRSWDNATDAHRVQSAEAWPGPARIASRRYTVKPYDATDPKQQAERKLWIPDPHGEHVYEGHRHRLEPGWVTWVLDFTEKQVPPEVAAEVAANEAKLAAE